MRRFNRVVLLALALALVLPRVGAAQADGLDESLLEARIEALRAQGASDDDPTLTAYLAGRNWLRQVTAFEGEAQGYADALTSAAQEEARILARIDVLDEAGEQDDVDLGAVSSEQLDARLTTLRTDLRDATGARDALDRLLAARETNASVSRERLGAISARLDELPDVGLTVNPQASPSAAEATQWSMAAERMALNAERRAQEARLASQPARYSLTRARRAELTGRIDGLSSQISNVQAALGSRRAEVIEPQDLGIEESNPLFGTARELAQRNAQLADERQALVGRRDSAVANSDDIASRVRGLGERFDTARRMVDFASDSDVLGTVLLVHWREIDSFIIRDPTQRISRAVGDTVISRIGHEEELADRASSTRFVARAFEAAGIDPASVAEGDRETLRSLVRASREPLTALIAAESDFIEALSDLDAGYRRLTALVGEYEKFLASRVLWVPNHPALYEANLKTVFAEGRGVFDALLGVRVERVRPGVIVGLLVALGLYFVRSRLSAARIGLNTRIARPREDSIRFTVAATLLSILYAAPIPLVLLMAAVLLGEAHMPVADALGSALQGLALVTIALLALKVAAREDGVGRVHFGWRADLCARLTLESDWLLRWWLWIAGVAVFTLTFNPHEGALGRLVLLVALVVLTARLMRGPALWLGVRGRQLRGLAVAISVGLLLSVVEGYVYSVRVVGASLVDTLWLAVGLALVYGVLMRWLRVARRHIRFTQLMAARTSEEDPEPDMDGMGLDELSEATTRLLRVGIITAGVLVLVYLWAPLLPAFDALDRVALWSTSRVVDGETTISSITLRSLVMVFFLGAGTFYAARRIPALVELILRSWRGVTSSGRYTTSTLLNYLIVGAGIITILSTLGLQWSQLQWLVAALGVGIGFGLQEIVANFISGLIILFERPIRVGDIVTVGENDGTVTRIRIRATTIRDWDGKELLVPNKEFITARLLNWSLSDPTTRVVIPVGIAYGSDVERAMRILDEICKDHDEILVEPKHSIVFTEFGDNALQLMLRCFIPSLDDRMRITTELHREIYQRFAEAGIVIAFPQRDVHFDAEQPIRIVLDPPTSS